MGMRFLIGLIVAMGIAILVALALVAYGIMRGVGGDAAAGFGELGIGLPSGCEIAEATLAEGRLVLRTGGLAERGCQQVIIIDMESGQEIGRLKGAPPAP
jgi:hypothetical protein